MRIGIGGGRPDELHATWIGEAFGGACRRVVGLSFDGIPTKANVWQLCSPWLLCEATQRILRSQHTVTESVLGCGVCKAVRGDLDACCLSVTCPFHFIERPCISSIQSTNRGMSCDARCACSSVNVARRSAGCQRRKEPQHPRGVQQELEST